MNYASQSEKFWKTKAYSSFMDNIWGADLADMQLLMRFLEYGIDVYSIYRGDILGTQRL